MARYSRSGKDEILGILHSKKLVNSHPFECGWFIKVEMNDAGELKNLMKPKLCDE
ncbi:Glycine cleavage H-protein [Corchorus capsularis]|uniref:Glycine cleavage H-protein n=1 Tax=Corchorus capsularis TaxID=210143 RepID=A0A1R3FWX7_COCAP|nr:Glycine cleavage H-protein [Corchorus capsularis]